VTDEPRKTRFARVPIKAASDRNLGATELRVLIAICAHVDASGRAWPSLSTIGDVAGLDPRRVPGAVKVIEQLGYMRRERRQHEDGGYTSTVYQIKYDGEVATPDVGDRTPPDATPRTPSHVTPSTAPDATVATLGMQGGRIPGCALTAHSSEQPNKQPKALSQRGSRLPTDFVLTDQRRAYALNKRPELDPESIFENFKDYWLEQPGQRGVKADWDAAWRRWVRTERSNGKSTGNTPGRSGGGGTRFDAVLAGARGALDRR
jgi:hypothetical protein